ncbi:dihydrofolate reductase family protein [Paeniglutamicibacter psychrophenolicus]|uniref:dihydrofolate reductase family protein n=1 Tax=Paeniglutamicibacter psychrophenolicus TaxID=257454 RepID=UPI0027D82509|nr:dihydrofolate reductase family protein [Paeniglutamicibacter psychrophenolicus]
MAPRQTPILAWHNSTVLGPDVREVVHGLRDWHEDVHVVGSPDFVQTLFTEQLFDRLTLWVCPILLGSRKEGVRQWSGSEEPQTQRTGCRFAQGRGSARIPPRQWHIWCR